jgi:hypothetical protein
LDIVQPKEIPDKHFWEKILVLILDLNSTQAPWNTHICEAKYGNTPVPLVVLLNFNFIGR